MVMQTEQLPFAGAHAPLGAPDRPLPCRGLLAVLLALALVAGSAGTAMGQTITVDPPGGTFDGVSIAPDGKCALREAIINANDDAATYPDCPSGGGADTITLPPGTTVKVLTTGSGQLPPR